LRLKPLWHQVAEYAPTAFVGTRQTEIRFSAETLLSFTPRDERDSAGLSVFQKSNYRYDLAVTSRGGRRVLVLRKTIGDIRNEEQLAILPSLGPVRLKITADQYTYQFQLADKSGNFTELASGLVNLLATELAGSWGGALVGMFCTSQEPTNAPAADFDYLDYQPIA
jgi:alpha-N-arabinofuranosidase